MHAHKFTHTHTHAAVGVRPGKPLGEGGHVLAVNFRARDVARVDGVQFVLVPQLLPCGVCQCARVSGCGHVTCARWSDCACVNVCQF